MSRAKLMVKTYLAVAVALLFLGCSKSREGAPKVEQGKHPADWIQQHWVEFTKNPDQCITCHGSYTDIKAAGGISGVSCFTCHAQGPTHHVAGWAAGAKHGRDYAMAAPSNTAGLSHCVACHGPSLAGTPQATSCMACHTTAPHPAKPWHGTTPSGSNHALTNVANAPECFKCHAAGARSSLPPPPAPVTGAAPGCYNNTMCHGNNPGHIAGWGDGAQHGFLGAMAEPTATTGFAYCATCHGTQYNSTATRSCLSCHTKAPHPSKPWSGTSASSHVFVKEGNATECAKCHVNGANSTKQPSAPAPVGTAPGCFNNTLCHSRNI